MRRNCTHCKTLLRPIVSLTDGEHRDVWGCEHCDNVCRLATSACRLCFDMKRASTF